MVLCTDHTLVHSENQNMDIKKKWTCPPSSMARYVYLKLQGPPANSKLCEIEVYEGNAPPIPNSEYNKLMGLRI